MPKPKKQVWKTIPDSKVVMLWQCQSCGSKEWIRNDGHDEHYWFGQVPCEFGGMKDYVKTQILVTPRSSSKERP